MLTGVLALAMVSCGDDDDDGGEDAGGTETTSGGTVSVFGAFVDAEAAAFEAALEPFEERTGIQVSYEGTGDFNNLIRIRAEADDLADIVIFPNPALLSEFAQDGDVVELTGGALDSFNDNYNESWQTFASVDDTPYGIFVKASPKSLVWYPRPEFEEAGYEVPETWDDMLALSDQIVADGGTPWCIGIEDGQSTGWVATDWLEDIVLRLHGADVYDQWVDHEIPFDDPQIVEAAEVMNEIWQNPDYVRGGTQTILSTRFGDSPAPMFEEEPGCYLHRQASFITTFFPDDVQATLTTEEPEAGVFGLPPIGDDPAPVMGGGDVAGMSNDDDAVVQTMAFLGTTEFAEGWAPAGGYISPHEGFDLDVYPTDLERQIGTLVSEAPASRFDASDLMPATVGAGSFFTAMVDIVGGEPPATAFAEVEESWPSD
jgi:alpha-glucoside transport system substrate-binding protein